MILYSILHTQKQNDRIPNITKTWGNAKNILFYSDHEDIECNVYKVSDNTEYSSGQEKQIKVFELLKIGDKKAKAIREKIKQATTL